ncbi:hypothetical protein CMUS01_14256 [Colletotrichum musicola]|uniref:Uncharacterized protein n=1 Tax=Colletotrichum musicola TaxID=2175873 RepID=A0A8H6J6H0_9PEZI|nr:hypothetical protein CMUS01_14256 [Colletotrichum musicola]
MMGGSTAGISSGSRDATSRLVLRSAKRSRRLERRKNQEKNESDPGRRAIELPRLPVRTLVFGMPGEPVRGIANQRSLPKVPRS